jgi:hypothetical protein
MLREFVRELLALFLPGLAASQFNRAERDTRGRRR